MSRLRVRTLCALFVLCVAASALGDTIAFGPRTYTIATGAPQTFSETIGLDPQECNGKTAFVAVVENAGVTSGELAFNGEVLLRESDFKQGAAKRELFLRAASSNVLNVTLKGGRPGSTLMLSIRKEVHEELAPRQTHTLERKQQTFSQSIQLGSSVSSAAVVVRLGDARPDSFTVRLNGMTVAGTSDLAGSVAVAYIALQTNNTLAVDVKGDSGDTINLAVVRVTGEGGCGPSISIDSPADGTVIPSARVAITGRIVAATRDIAVTVNGQVAEVDLWHVGTETDPFRFAAIVEAAAGALKLEAVAVDGQGGEGTAVRSVSVSPVPEPFVLLANVDRGVAPHTASYSIQTDAPERLQSFDVDYNADGTYEVVNAQSLGTPLTITYAAPGIYTARLRARDRSGATFTSAAYITVQHPAAIDSVVQARWTQLREAFAAQDVDGALDQFTLSSREKYRRAFTDLFYRLPAIAAGMTGAPRAVTIEADWADYLVTRVEDGRTRGYHLSVMRDASGIWKIDDF